MTVYKAVKTEAQDAARMAVALAKGKPLPANLVNQHTNNGKTSVPSVILTPVAVTKANVASTVVKDGYWTPAQICTQGVRRAPASPPGSASHDDRATTPARPQGRQQEVRRGPGARRRGLRGPRRRGRRARRRQRRRQVDAGEDHLRHLLARRGRVRGRRRGGDDPRARGRRRSSASPPCTRTWRWPTTSTSSPTCSSAARSCRAGPGG